MSAVNLSKSLSPYIEIHKTQQSRLTEIDFNNLPFGKTFSDHMLSITYMDGKWQQPVIKPYGNLSLSPASTVFHYGQGIFEGMKAHRNPKTGDIIFFRPDENWKRFNRSAERLAMPAVPKNLFLDGLYQLVELDKAWVPNEPNSSLYLRPFMIGCDDFIGVRAARKYEFCIITGPTGPYYSGDVKVLIEDKYIRASEGGTGDVKAAGNYAGTMYPAQLAQEKGYNQILWTDGKEHKYVEEIGTMNVFFIIDGVVCTPELTGTILPGITRASIMQLFQATGFEVQERKISVDEIIDAHNKGILQDVFGAGTAATVTYITELGYQGKNYKLPSIESRTASAKIKNQMENIKRGLETAPTNWFLKTIKA